MKANILATAVALSDQDLLARLDALAGQERQASVEIVAHLAALEMRPVLYSAQGYGSLFSYCTEALRLSEDAACNRIDVARACRRFPVILDFLVSGSVSLTSVRLLSRHLTADNHQAVLAKAANKTRREIECLVAELAPRPDVPASVRRVPIHKAALAVSSMRVCLPSPSPTTPASSPSASVPTPAVGSAPFATTTEIGPSPTVFLPTPRPIVEALSPQRYRVQFTIGEETHDQLRRVQALLRREIPDGDPGAIFARALDLLLEQVEKTKVGATARPRPRGPIRPGTDKEMRDTTRPSRHIPAEVKRAVWRRDGAQCAFVAPTGRRCTERAFLELHHVQPYARQGPATVENISLRCWRHNQYEAELVFGSHGASTLGEAREAFDPPRKGVESCVSDRSVISP